MDIYCPRCGEPVDMDYLHDVAEDQDTTYRAVLRDFQQRGCVAIDFGECERSDSLEAMYADALYDLLGDDVDGAASMLQDCFG